MIQSQEPLERAGIGGLWGGAKGATGGEVYRRSQ